MTTHRNNIRQKRAAVVEGDHQGGAGAVEKKLVKCKHYPNCRQTDETCPFVHPKDNCKFFPFCDKGDKCLYIHADVSDTLSPMITFLSRLNASSVSTVLSQHATINILRDLWEPYPALRGSSKR